MKHRWECIVCGMPRDTAEDLPYDNCRGHRGAPSLGPVRKKPQAERLGELTPGATYALRCTEDVAPHVFEQFAVAVQRACEDSSIKFVLIAHNLEFVEPPATSSCCGEDIADRAPCK